MTAIQPNTLVKVDDGTVQFEHYVKEVGYDVDHSIYLIFNRHTEKDEWFAASEVTRILEICPFCNGEPDMVVGNKKVEIKCTSCKVKKTQKVIRKSTEWLKESMIHWWNTRDSYTMIKHEAVHEHKVKIREKYSNEIRWFERKFPNGLGYIHPETGDFIGVQVITKQFIKELLEVHDDKNRDKKYYIGADPIEEPEQVAGLVECMGCHCSWNAIFYKSSQQLECPHCHRMSPFKIIHKNEN